MIHEQMTKGQEVHEEMIHVQNNRGSIMFLGTCTFDRLVGLKIYLAYFFN